MNLTLIFLTGLTTGGLSCLALQGGLLASVLANQATTGKGDSESKVPAAVQSAVAFLLSKLAAHAVLGLLLGMLGSVVTLSLGWRIFFQMISAAFMAATAMNILDVHPVFRLVSLQPPKSLWKRLKNLSRHESLFAPMVLGAATVLVPCGVTQAMEVVALTSGSAVSGMLVMAVFVLGTMPLFLLLGLAAAGLTAQWRQRFSKVTAWLLIGMAIYGFNGGLVALDAPLTLQKITAPVRYFFSAERFAPAPAEVTEGSVGVDNQGSIQRVNIQVLNSGYQPRYIRVKRGIPVELTLTSNDVYSCALSFVFKEFGIETFLDSTDSRSFTFTPTKPGKYTFSCSMGMYSGVLEVL